MTAGGYLGCTTRKQFYTDQSETLQALLSWSIDMNVILVL